MNFTKHTNKPAPFGVQKHTYLNFQMTPHSYPESLYVPIRNADTYREIYRLNKEIQSLKLEIEIQKIMLKKLTRCEIIINSFQEILFDNSDSIPNGLYLKLMNSLVGKI